MRMVELFIFLGGLIAFFLLGFPVAISIGLTSIFYLIMQNGIGDIPFTMIAQRMLYGVNNFTILAIPLFLLTGKLMNSGKITHKLFGFANILVGYLPGGLGHANVVASIIFAGMSGSAVADSAGLGTIEIEAMDNEGYDRDFSAAVTAASSTIGPIVPPSIPAVMIGVMGNLSVSKLLIGGIIPGVLMGLSLMILIWYYSIKFKYPRKPLPTTKIIVSSFKEAFLPLLTPIILVGGIITGWFTATEAAAVAAVYALVLSMFVYRTVKLADLWDIFKETLKDTSMILFIVATASLYGWLIVRAQLPIMISDKIVTLSQNPVVILLIINAFLLIVGMFMESLAAITILTPILVPVVVKLGVDPIHFGVLMNLVLMIGLITPPLGVCLYAVSKVAKRPLGAVVRKTAPFYLPLLLVMLLITFFPKIITFLPNLLNR